MKKILLSASILLSMTAIVNAQTAYPGRVGVNTPTPAATMDITAVADATRPDALLVPRMSEDVLASKNLVYAADQNGALVFVNAVDGATTAKTVNVTTTGFYYYDAATSVWVKVGGGVAPVTAKPARVTSTGALSNADLNGYVIATVNVTYNLASLTAAANGDTITLTSTDPGLFTVTGASATSSVTPPAQGGGLTYVYVSSTASWYSISGF